LIFFIKNQFPPHQNPKSKKSTCWPSVCNRCYRHDKPNRYKGSSMIPLGNWKTLSFSKRQCLLFTKKRRGFSQK
jgi:hypothetical protein